MGRDGILSDREIARSSRLRPLIGAIVAIDLAGLLLALWLQYGAGASSRFVPNYGGEIAGLAFAIAQFVSLGFGVLIADRHPRNPVGWLFIASATFFTLDEPITYYVIYAIHITGRALPGADLMGSVEQSLWVPGVLTVVVLLPLVFPTGRLLSRRWWAVVWLAVAGAASGIASTTLGSAHDNSSLIGGVRPFVAPVQLAPLGDALSFGFVLLLLAVLMAVVSLALRYARGGAEERHQIKWLIFAIVVYGVGSLVRLGGQWFHYTIPGLETVAVVGLVLVPISAAVAVLKYRLYDIDVVISRTLVYGALAAFISAVYVGIVVGVGSLVGSGGKPNLALSIVATAVVAVAFQPVRERLQRIANRLVYGRRATPYEVLSQFSSRVAESYAGEQVLPRMAQVLAEGTGAERAEVWLRRGNGLLPAASWPVGTATDRDPVELTGQLLPQLPGADRAIPVRHQGELLGALSVRKRAGEALTPIEESLLADLANQAGLLLKNVGLAADLQARLIDLRASRQRLVAAQDDERRKLERNLHDGAQQHLVAIKVKLGLVELLVKRDPERARATLGQLKVDTDEALETLRDLARGIYPPLLAARGLAAALPSQAAKASLPVEVGVEGIGRYLQDVEAAVYFCCLEALQNVQKYADATRVRLSISETEGRLVFEVGDDGRGFDPGTTQRGAGLDNMRDRLDALGGTLEITSAPDAGTLVRGALPVEVTAAAP